MKKIFYNGVVFPSANARPVEAIYIEDGKIAALGSYADLRLQFGRPDAKMIDLQGSFVYPGFVDSHLHLAGHGMRLSMLDLSGAKSKEEMLDLLLEEVRQTAVGDWVIGLNWNENDWKRRLIPTKQELDAISDKHPILLTRTCSHVHLANTLAFERAGVRADPDDPADGSFGRDASGNLNGLIYEQAAEPFFNAQPPTDRATKKEYVKKAMRHALQLGLTAAHTEDLRYLGDMDTLTRVYRELLEEGLYFRTHHLIYHRHLHELDELNLGTSDGNEWFQIGAVKIFADGTIGGRTALLSAPYADDPATRGIAIHSTEQLNEIAREARRRNMPIAVHAIGDEGIERAIQTMEAFPAPRSTTRRDRLIHAQLIRGDQIKRLFNLRVAVDIQPRFVASDFPWVFDRVGKQWRETLYPWKTLIRSGVPCGGGSDAPIEPLDPLLGIHAAVTRRKPEETHDGYVPEEKLNPSEAIYLFTLGGAQAATEEHERGSLEVGKYADLTVLDANLFAVDADNLLNATTRMTVVNGKIAYRDGI